MKTSHLIAILFLIISCSSEQKEVSKIKGISVLQEKQVQSLLGVWSLCKMMNGNTNTMFNVCPQIIFNKNKTGFFKYSTPG